jgi:hypothetical protein
VTSSGDSLTITVTVEIDPDAATAIYNTNGELDNQATATGEDPNNPGTQVTDESDDPADPTQLDPGADNNPDDPTSLVIPNIELTKTLLGTVPASSGANPPSSPTLVASPFSASSIFNALNISTPAQSASRNVVIDTGWIMNSCISTLLSA